MTKKQIQKIQQLKKELDFLYSYPQAQEWKIKKLQDDLIKIESK